MATAPKYPTAYQLARDVSQALSSIRFNVERPIGRDTSSDSETFIAVSLEIERLRLKLKAATNRGRRGHHSLAVDALEDVKISLSILLDDSYMMSTLGGKRVTPRSDIPLMGSADTLESAIRTLLYQIRQIVPDGSSITNVDLAHLRAIIPDQKIAPC